MIEVERATVRYKRVTVLDEIDFRVDQGESVALVGESGAGKSTLARLLLGLEDPSSGRVRFDGIAVSDMSRRRRRAWRREVQALFQSPLDSFNPRIRLGRSLLEPLAIVGGAVSVKSAGDILAGLLDEVGLDADIAERYPSEVSGGQLQRVALARTLSTKPRVLVLDEPVSALDVSARAQILELVNTVRVRHQCSVVFITHDLATVGYVCGSVYVMRGGRIVDHVQTAALATGSVTGYTRELLEASVDPIGYGASKAVL